MDGIPAGCEGDTCSLLGMMLTKELFGIVPWIANVTHVNSNRILFSHCTIPANLLVDFELDTHFESGKGLAIKGKLKADEVTILRLDHTLSKLFVGTGKIIEEPYQKMGCRTQLAVSVSPDVVDYFVNAPLGNHHLIIPGNLTLGFDIASRILRMERV
jgi:L-fucose isomerase-like protein